MTPDPSRLDAWMFVLTVIGVFVAFGVIALMNRTAELSERMRLLETSVRIHLEKRL